METSDDHLRVYLDTAVLMEIADRPDDWPDAGFLRNAMDAAGAVLVVSLGHPWDAYRSADEATQDRVIRAVNAFPRKAMAAGHPHEAERAELDRVYRGEVDVSAAGKTDVRLYEFEDLRVVLSSEPEIVPMVQLLGTVSSGMNQAEQRARQIAPVAKSNDEQRAKLAIVERLLSGGSLPDVMKQMLGPAANTPEAQAMLAAFGAMDGGPAMDRIRASVQATSAAVVAKNFAKNPAGVVVGSPWLGRKGGLEGWEKIAPDVTPGDYVVYAATKANDRDPHRAPDDGDFADRLHLGLLPYMDLATVDAHNFGAISTAMKRIRAPRAARVHKNPPRDTLQPIVDAVASARSR